MVYFRAGVISNVDTGIYGTTSYIVFLDIQISTLNSSIQYKSKINQHSILS